MTRTWEKLKLTIALLARNKSHYCSAHVWPAGDVSLQTPWSLWRRRRSSSSSSCRCRRSPLQTWSSPLWSPRSAGERERTRGSSEGVLMFQKGRSFKDVFTFRPSNAPLYNAEPPWRWSAVSSCRSWLDACCRLWPDSSDNDIGSHCPPPRIAAKTKSIST